MSTLEWTAVRDCAPERLARIGAGLLAQMDEAPGAAPRLVVAELAGDALVLGRHQRASSALALDAVAAAGLPIVRRAGGGRTVRAGAGTLGVLLAVPSIGALLPAAVGADKVINRYVRGLLAGLTSVCGSGVHYFGRDFVSAEGRQVGVVSQDGTPGGAALFEAIVGVERSLALEPAWNGYPAHADPRAAGPEAVALAALAKQPHAFDEIAPRIADGYARVYGCDAVPSAAALPEGELPEPAVREDEAGWEESGVADVAIGFAEALVRHDGAAVTDARLRGDFIAPAFAVRALEARLAGCPLDFAAIGARVDAAFHQPGAAMIGLRSLRVLADAVLAAAGRL